jgi:hypothetical protein
MKRLTLALKIYIGLVIVMALLMALSIFLPAYQGLMPTEELPASKPVLALVNAAMALFLYGGLGYLGYILSRKLGFADIWSPDVTHRQRFLYPALIGAGLGVFFIVARLPSQPASIGHCRHRRGDSLPSVLRLLLDLANWTYSTEG